MQVETANKVKKARMFQKEAKELLDKAHVIEDGCVDIEDKISKLKTDLRELEIGRKKLRDEALDKEGQAQMLFKLAFDEYTKNYKSDEAKQAAWEGFFDGLNDGGKTT